MTKTTKTLLALALGGTVAGLVFASGLIDVQEFSALYIALPLGAVFFGLFLISRMLEREAQLFDQEHAGSAAAPSPAGEASECCAGRRPQHALATAGGH